MRRGSCLSILLIATICFFSLTSMWQNSDVSQIEEEPANILKKDNEYNVNFPQPQETFKENLPFRYFDAKSLYQTEGIVTRSLNQYEMAMVTKAKEVVQEKLENLKPDSSFVNGRYRWLPDGVEYDLLYRESTTLDTTRVSLFQKLEVPKVIMSREINKNTV
ncbi:hypothetical protein SK128_004630 [Halocaridina rubra]|uniref:Uncharacterized protein n=1 Tax=Halocaridina rubra TaxID=373956 RepID=A0AAN8XNV5_HALRR